MAYSGGVDSTLLLKVAKDTLGDGAGGLLIHSPLHSPRELTEARRMAKAMGVNLLEMTLDELQVEGVRMNAPDRCYHCKRYRFSLALEVAERQGAALVEGSNRDDLGDYRPGLRAIGELGVLSPLLEVGLGKDEIRTLARAMALPVWDKPSSACLATRIPYGQPLDRGLLERVASAEELLMDLGFRGFRVRCHGELARIELEEADLERALANRKAITHGLKVLGFRYICLDLEGYRTSGLSFRRDHEG